MSKSMVYAIIAVFMLAAAWNVYVLLDHELDNNVFWLRLIASALLIVGAIVTFAHRHKK
jgi:ABC-type nickel/cobalt efflux system permease component RcnA